MKMYPQAVWAQIQVACEHYEETFGQAPRGIWLPECAYRPAFIDDKGKTRAGIESYLAENGIKVCFSETHTITGGQPVGIAAGDVLGPYGEIKRRYVIPAAKAPMPKTSAKPAKVTPAGGDEDWQTF